LGDPEAMISKVDVGQILAVLGLSYSGPLFEGVFLSIKDQKLFRRLAQEALLSGRDAYFDQHVFAWIYDWEKACDDFLAAYGRTAASEDVANFKWWIQNGYNGVEEPDQIRHVWHEVLHWMKHHDEWQAGLSPQAVARAVDFAKSMTAHRRSEKFMRVIDDIRDHLDNDPDTLLKMKVRLEFYDDLMDPLLIFTNIRGQLILMEAVRKSLHDAELIDTLNRIPSVWWQHEGKKYEIFDGALVLNTTIEELAPS
jgi:hypothetical protein